MIWHYYVTAYLDICVMGWNIFNTISHNVPHVTQIHLIIAYMSEYMPFLMTAYRNEIDSVIIFMPFGTDLMSIRHILLFS